MISQYIKSLADREGVITRNTIDFKKNEGLRGGLFIVTIAKNEGCGQTIHEGYGRGSSNVGLFLREMSFYVPTGSGECFVKICLCKYSCEAHLDKWRRYEKRGHEIFESHNVSIENSAGNAESFVTFVSNFLPKRP